MLVPRQPQGCGRWVPGLILEWQQKLCGKQVALQPPPSGEQQESECLEATSDLISCELSNGFGHATQTCRKLRGLSRASSTWAGVSSNTSFKAGVTCLGRYELLLDWFINHLKTNSLRMVQGFHIQLNRGWRTELSCEDHSALASRAFKKIDLWALTSGILMLNGWSGT